jgi:hypothetical protein
MMQAGVPIIQGSIEPFPSPRDSASQCPYPPQYCSVEAFSEGNMFESSRWRAQLSIVPGHPSAV